MLSVAEHFTVRLRTYFSDKQHLFRILFKHYLLLYCTSSARNISPLYL